MPFVIPPQRSEPVCYASLIVEQTSGPTPMYLLDVDKDAESPLYLRYEGFDTTFSSTFTFRFAHHLRFSVLALNTYFLKREDHTRETLLASSHLNNDLIDLVLTYALSCLTIKKRTIS
jgi:hypothetical protein